MFVYSVEDNFLNENCLHISGTVPRSGQGCNIKFCLSNFSSSTNKYIEDEPRLFTYNEPKYIIRRIERMSSGAQCLSTCNWKTQSDFGLCTASEGYSTDFVIFK